MEKDTKWWYKKHAINPDTDKTFCGRNLDDVWESLPIDIVDGLWYNSDYCESELCKICKDATKWKETKEELENLVLTYD